MCIVNSHLIETDFSTYLTFDIKIERIVFLIYPPPRKNHFNSVCKPDSIISIEMHFKNKYSLMRINCKSIKFNNQS